MKLKLSILAFAAASLSGAWADSFTSTTATGVLNSSRWNNTSDAAPYTSAYTANNAISFTSTSTTYLFSGAATSGAVNVGNITLANNVGVRFTAASGTLGTNGSVRTLSIGTGAILDLGSQSISTTSGTGFIKSGEGILFSSNGNAYNGGFTLNAGTIIVGGVNAMGNGGALNINGGTIAANATRNITARYSSINIGGNFTIGGVTTGVTSGNGSATANITFADNVGLGAATRTITIGSNGTYTFGGILSGATGTGLTIAASSGATGKITLSGASTYSGATTINGGTLAVNGSLASGSAVTVNDGGALGGSGTAAGTVTVNSGGKIGPGNSPGVLTTGAATFNTGSIFSWDIAAVASGTRGTNYDGLNTPSVSGSGAIFQIVLQGSDTFGSTFWDTSRTWTDIFKTGNAGTNVSWTSVFGGGFQYVDGTGATISAPTAQGSFSLTGDNTLTWTAVPEPTTALAGLLLGAGLLRRRRVA